jgi:hypothetical protein
LSLPEPVKGTILAPKPRESGECRYRELTTPGTKPLAPPFVRHGQAAQAEAGEGFRAVSRAFEALD